MTRRKGISYAADSFHPLLLVHTDVPAAGAGILLHLEVVQRHSEVAQNRVPQLLQLSQGLILELRHLLVIQYLQLPSEICDDSSQMKMCLR